MNSKKYILNIILCIVTVFMLCFSAVAVLMISIFTNSNNYIKIVNKNDVYSYVEDSLKSDFEEYSHTSGTETEIFEGFYSSEFVKKSVDENVKSAIDYLNGKSESYNYYDSVDYTEADKVIEDFFESYAEENNCEKDETYETKLSETKENAHDSFKSNTDVFRFSLMQENGILGKIPSKLSLMKKLSVVLLILTIIMIVVMFFVNKKNSLCYWLGCPFVVSFVLLMIPMIYIKATHFINGFTIKDKPVFYSVTGILNKSVNEVIIVAIIFAIIGFGLMIFNKLKAKKD